MSACVCSTHRGDERYSKKVCVLWAQLSLCVKEKSFSIVNTSHAQSLWRCWNIKNCCENFEVFKIFFFRNLNFLNVLKKFHILLQPQTHILLLHHIKLLSSTHTHAPTKRKGNKKMSNGIIKVNNMCITTHFLVFLS